MSASTEEWWDLRPGFFATDPVKATDLNIAFFKDVFEDAESQGAPQTASVYTHADKNVEPWDIRVIVMWKEEV